MPYVQLEGLQYPLEPGENSIGAGPEARLRLPGLPQQGVLAILDMADDGTVILRGGAAPVKVNGLELGDQPTPLIHGDKLEIGGRALYFGDDRRAGRTTYMPAAQAPDLAERTADRSPGTATTGGRLVSLVDGREYPIGEAGLVIGRDPSCDIVVPSNDASRRHATLKLTANGYVVADTSTNGVSVNGSRIDGHRLLARGDVINIAGEEFRFYAEPPTPPAVPRPLLATLEVVGTSTLKGRRFDVRLPLVHVGRGEHNEIVLADESVSDTHATLQQREAGEWVVTDMESTNGTYVGGRRVYGLMPLHSGADVRFGGIKLMFRAAERHSAAGKGTRVIAPPAEAARRSPPRRVPATGTGSAPAGFPSIVWILLAGLLAIVVFIVLTSC